MNLYRIGDRRPNYKKTYFKGRDLEGLKVYSADDHCVGHVDDFLVDEGDRIRYVVVANKNEKTLVPVDSCTEMPNENRISTPTLNREEHKVLPLYDDSRAEEKNYALQMHQTNPVEATAPVDGQAVVIAQERDYSTSQVSKQEQAADAAQNRPIQLYEERLTTRKQRVKTGEIKISKRVVTETKNTQTPVTREKVIIEIESIYGGETRVNFGDAKVAEDGTMRMGIYEEQAEVCRRVVPYQNIAVRKETVQDVVTTQATVRREELDLSSDDVIVENVADFR